MPLLAHSHVPRLHSWLYTRSELHLWGIVIGQLKVRTMSTAWRAFTKTSALWEASCCCVLLAQENIRSMHCCGCTRKLQQIAVVKASGCALWTLSGHHFKRNKTA